METIIWIFHNVMPWMGVYLVIMTIAFFVLLSINLLKYKGIKNIYTDYDITELAIEASVVVNIIPIIFIKLISWSVEKIIKKIKS